MTSVQAPKLSVVIANYNYAKFVGHAIESALAIDWPNLEVVVIDDGSTDNSRTVIEAFSRSVRSVFTVNRGQREAVNLGFTESTGDAIIFLDSDDVLPANVGHEVFGNLAANVSKIQFSVEKIDDRGKSLGGLPSPQLASVPSPSEIRRWMLKTSAYPTPPHSGNAYPRWFLDRIMPLGPEIGNYADSGLLAVAPILGDVIVRPEVRVGYRQHVLNDSNMLKNANAFSREIDRARRRWQYARSFMPIEVSKKLGDSPLRRSRELLQFRVAARRMEGAGSGLPGDTKSTLLLDTLLSGFFPGPESKTKRLKIILWTLSIFFSPNRFLRLLLEARYHS